MSNLHKNLLNDELHDPKDFVGAANNTKLTKDGTGALVWAADGGGGGGGLVTSLTTTGTSGASTLSGSGVLNIPTYAGGVSKIVAGNNVTISPVSGYGDVTINSSSTSNNYVARNIQCYGAIAGGVEWGLGAASGNNEHKFITNLGSPGLTSMAPRNMVTSAIWVNPTGGSTLKNWSGWLYGAANMTVVISLLRVKLLCPIKGEYPATVPVCRSAFQNITLTGNTTPICFNISNFTNCDGWPEALAPNEVLVLSASTLDKEAGFTMNTNIMIGLI